jgi:hypothetical protein
MVGIRRNSEVGGDPAAEDRTGTNTASARGSHAGRRSPEKPAHRTMKIKGLHNLGSRIAPSLGRGPGVDLLKGHEHRLAEKPLLGLRGG